MIEHIWTVLCSRAIVDRRSNNVSLIHVVDQFTLEVPKEAPERVVVPVELTVASLWRREDDEAPVASDGRLYIQFPNGERIQAQEFEIDLSEHSRTRNFVEMNGLPVQRSGVYRFVVERERDGEWIEISRTPLQVIKNIQPDREEVESKVS